MSLLKLTPFVSMVAIASSCLAACRNHAKPNDGGPESTSGGAVGASWGSFFDGPPAPDTKLQRERFGNSTIALHLPEAWVGEQHSILDGSGMVSMAEDRPRDRARTRLLIANLHEPPRDVDPQTTKWIGTQSHAEVQDPVQWHTRTTAKLGPDHVEVRVDRGSDAKKPWEYWRIVAPSSADDTKMIIASIHKDAAPEDRALLIASLRSTVVR